MSEPTENAPSEAVQKYKTLARALAANDEPACRELYAVYKSQGKELNDEEVFALGMRWFLNKKGRDHALVPFLADLKFNFEQVILLDQKTENVGTKLPFRLIGSDKDEDLLLYLLNNKYVDLDVRDGLGDNLLTEALQRSRFDFAEKLLALGVSLNETNLGGQAPLHIFASRLNFQAVEWLCQHNADPTLEDLQNARPSEMVPEVMDGWDPQSMFDVLEDYVDRYNLGQKFEGNAEFSEMVNKERAEQNPTEEDGQTYGEQANEAKSILTQLGL